MIIHSFRHTLFHIAFCTNLLAISLGHGIRPSIEMLIPFFYEFGYHKKFKKFVD